MDVALNVCFIKLVDCWDGVDGPVIYHGHTFVTKIPLFDVLQVIKEYAFVCADTPLILSLEMHCSLPQQDLIASILLEIFGDCIYTEKIEAQLPSPKMLFRRVLVKVILCQVKRTQSERSLLLLSLLM